MSVLEASDLLTWSCWRLWAPLKGRTIAEEMAAHHSFGTQFLLTSPEIQSGTGWASCSTEMGIVLTVRDKISIGL